MGGRLPLRILAPALATIAVARTVVAQPMPPVAAEPTAAVIAWTRTRVSPIDTDLTASTDNLRRLQRVIGQATVIGLGEAAHGVHEFLSLRNQLVPYLVQSMGVTAIAAETGYSESIAVDDYILGKDELNPSVIGSVFSWSKSVPYSENRALLEWLRAYNARPTTKRRIHFYGLDLTGGRVGRFVEARLAIDSALAFVSAVDTAQARRLHQQLDPLASRFSSAGYDSLSASEQNALSAAIDDLVNLFDRRQVSWTARTSVQAYDRARQQAVVASQLNANFRAAPAESNPQAQREPAMAHNVAWVLEREGPEGRVLVFAADWHVSKGPMFSDRWGMSLGEYLAANLAKNYVTIGTTFGRMQASDSDTPQAPAAGSVAAMMSQLCTRTCLLDLSALPQDGSVDKWYRGLRPIRAGRNDIVALSQAFNAVVYFDVVHPAHF